MPTGVGWWLLAPLPQLVRRADGVVPAGPAEAAVAADGWFAVCAAVAGALAGIVVAVAVRRDRLAGLAGLTVGGALGAVLAWQLGMLLGPGPVADAAARVSAGDRFAGPLRLSALGVLLMWPMTAAVLFFAGVAGLDHAPSAGPGNRGRHRAGDPHQVPGVE